MKMGMRNYVAAAAVVAFFRDMFLYFYFIFFVDSKLIFGAALSGPNLSMAHI